MSEAEAPLPSRERDPYSDKEVLRRYRRAMADAKPEHDRVKQEILDSYAAYGLESFKSGGDFAGMAEVWGNQPPEIAVLLSTVNAWLGSVLSSRLEPTFPGFDLGTEDAVLGEALSMLITAGRRWAGSKEVDANVLLDGILSGYGFARLALETEARPPFRPDEEFVTADRVFWDPGGHDGNLRGSEEFIVRDPYSIDEAIAEFPEHAQTLEALRLDQGADGGGHGIREGVNSVNLGGKVVGVTISNVDGRETGKSGTGASTRRLREVPIDDFQFRCWETMIGFLQADPMKPDAPPRWHEVLKKDWEQGLESQEAEAELSGMPFEPPAHRQYKKATWYRARILATSLLGEPKVLVSAQPIHGDQRLVRCLTCYAQRYSQEGGEDGGLRTRFFGWGRVLIGLQRLFSVAMRIYVEQEARRNRDGWDVDESAFGGDKKQLDDFISSRRIPGGVFVGKDGFGEKVRQRNEGPKTHTQEAKEMFSFLAEDLPAYSLGVSSVTKGAFNEDRSAKFLAAVQESQIQMQNWITQAYTSYLDEGSATMCRLMLALLDAQDIDRLLGVQPPKEGLNAERDETGALVPMMVPDPESEEGELVEMTVGRYLKENGREILDNDISFGLKPSAASERMARAMLMAQHGVFEQLSGMLEGIPGAKEMLAPVVLRDSLLEGGDYAVLADKLEALVRQQEKERAEQAKVATDEGFVQYVAQKAASGDLDGAIALMQQASAAVTGQEPAAPAGPEGAPPPPETVQ